MRPITGTDVIDFHNTRYDLLVLDADGKVAHIDTSDVVSSSYEDNRATAYSYVTLEDGSEVQVLLERTTIDDGEWFPDALDEQGDLIPSVAGEMADIINADSGLGELIRVREVQDATTEWENAAQEADRLAMVRARKVAGFVEFYGGNQSAAARRLGLDQSTVNKLVRKVAT